MSLDLTQFVKDLKIEKGIRPLQSLNNEKHFEPIPNGFYGFSIDMSDLFAPANIYCGHESHLWVSWTNEPDKLFCNYCKIPFSEYESGTIDVDHEDLTNQKLLK